MTAQTYYLAGIPSTGMPVPQPITQATLLSMTTLWLSGPPRNVTLDLSAAEDAHLKKCGALH